MEKLKNIPQNVPDGSIESGQVCFEKRTDEAHEIAARLMAEHFASDPKKKPVQD